MSFWIYHCEDECYRRLQPLKLTGTDGLLTHFLRRHSHEETPFAWCLGDADILHLARPDLNSRTHRIVFDMMPESPDDVSLYRVCQLQGSSELDESDVVLTCNVLFQENAPAAATALRSAFRIDKPASPRLVLEVLRLSGGTLRGRYLWGRPKMDIGAAVCPASTATVNKTQPSKKL